MDARAASPTRFQPVWRPWLARQVRRATTPALMILLVHAAIRFGGLWNPMYIPLSMAIVLPLPWLLSPREGRTHIGLRIPERRGWLVLGPTLALVGLGICAVLAWGAFGESASNWFTRHALALDEALSRIPPDASAAGRFWMVTGPAMFFSPLAEEFLFRGYVQTTFGERWGERTGIFLQAAAFALVHLAHYGLAPAQPALMAVWIPSMFGVAVLLGWIVRRAGSLWPAILGHALFNLGMNAVVFLWLPELVS